ncbi:sigma-54-dependent Fis family transcriptional regulator [Enterovibrio sp. ZSDZ42]|uniref:Sigma-54-dependent Fis family transcriptional regulator n=1 Tax=Enterovibrio gelatinilyticus TaxID=2899819 RepID=A0ABT5R4V8_9GAMM|nr:sigma-54-dependent Fis family transcriptional regulator [Enterovibrio sp. ZSDZ42]MDD1795301.1 sigma-54-dependent Fis family transcriptional regulator [Enterovibrio sp. ZSDZ42]
MSDKAHSHSEIIQASWRRCQSFGLSQKNSPEIVKLDTGDWGDVRDRSHDLIATTQEQVLPFYENILVNSNSLVLLADNDGNLLSRWGRPGFINQMEKHLFDEGTNWREKYNGTNAVGTALQTGEAVAVGRDEHYLIANRYMTASAAPIFNSDRHLVGVLNISSDAYLPTSHVAGMVKVMTQSVENQLIIATYRHHCHMLTFNTSSDNLASQWAGLLVFNETGDIIAANRRADLLVGQTLVGLDIGSVTGISALKLSAHPEHHPLSFIGLSKYRLFGTIKRPVNRAIRSPLSVPFPISGSSIPSQKAAIKPSERQLQHLDLGDIKMQKAIRQAQSVVNSDIPLVIQGETGVGKEVFAKATHASSSRAHKKLVAVNCAAIPADLVESELFGYVKGAFTGANTKGSIGYIRQADGGTLMLDEIGDMPLHVQARLLRVLQEKAVTPLGSTESYSVDFRVICATHQSLREAVAQKKFREDLYYRINGLTLFLPALKERSDINALVNVLLPELAGEISTQIDDEVFALFNRHPWPGNIRQLVNTLRVALALSNNERVQTHHLPDDFFLDLRNDVIPLSSQPEVTPRVASWRESLPLLYAETEGNITRIAEISGVSRNTIYKRLRMLGIK